MSSEDEKVDSEIKYAWRPATRGDIGSVARFGDSDSKHEPWVYGILKEINTIARFGNHGRTVYVCEPTCYEEDDQGFFNCEIQYVADENP